MARLLCSDFEADTVYYETVYYTSIMPKLVKAGRL